MRYRRKVDFPVPALPVIRTFFEELAMISQALWNWGLKSSSGYVIFWIILPSNEKAKKVFAKIIIYPDEGLKMRSRGE
jgi:hypothetical protein